MFVCVLDHRRRRSDVRLILPSANGPKSVDDIERPSRQRIDEVLDRMGCELDRDRGWDLATFAGSNGVPPGSRRRPVGRRGGGSRCGCLSWGGVSGNTSRHEPPASDDRDRRDERHR